MVTCIWKVEAVKVSISSRPFLGLSLLAVILLVIPGASFAQAPSPMATPPPAARVIPTPDVVRGNKPSEVYYTVRRGDTLWLIARRFGVTVDLIARTNGFNGKKVLREGMRLYLPYSNEAGSVKLQAGGPVVTGQGLHFVASIHKQTCWLFEDGSLRNRWTCSTGRPGSPSILGNYTVRTKLPRAYNAAADFWMPAWLGIYEAAEWENGIHGIPYRASNGERLWTDLVGTPITYGCVMLADKLAQELYQIAYIGMPVTILE